MSDVPTRTAPQPAAKSAESTAASPPRKKSRKLRYFLVVFFILMVGLVALAPTLASLPPLTSYALSFANDRLAGQMTVKSIGLTWFGSTKIEGLNVRDPDRRDVISVAKIVCNNGLWNFARNWESFGEVTIESPKVELIFNKDNDLSLAQAFSSRTPSPSQPSSGPLPQPRGKLVIKNGTIRVVQANGEAFEVSDFEGQFKVNTLGDLVGQLAAALTGGGKLNGDVSLQDLVHNGQLQPRKAKGTVKLATDGLVKIGPIASIVARQQGLDGSARLKLDASFDAGTIRAALDAAIEQLQTRQRAAAKAAPLDLAFVSKLDVVGDKLTANTKLSGQAGTATADLEYRITEKPFEIDADRLLSAILTGQSINLPDFTLNANADIDLATLERAVPGLLTMGEGRQITSGKFIIEKVSVTGGTSAAASGTVQVRDVAATNEGKTVRLEPMTLAFDAGIVPEKGLQVRAADLKTCFANIKGSGAATNLKASYDANLSRLKQELSQLVDMTGYELAGDLNGSVELSRESDDRVNVAMQTTGNAIRYTSKDGTLDLPKVALRETGHLTLKRNQVQSFTAEKAQADINGELLASASGMFDLVNQAFDAEVEVQKAELGALGRRLAPLGMKDLARYAGTVVAKAKATRGGPKSPIESSGTMTAQNLTVDGKPLADRNVTAEWAGVRIADNGGLSISSAKLESAFAKLAANGVRFENTTPVVLTGNVDVSADLQKTFQAVAPLANMPKPPDIAGQLAWSAKCGASGSAVSLDGRGGIDQLEFGAAKNRVHAGKVDIDCDAKLDPKTDRIDIGKARVASQFLNVTASGNIDRFRQDCALNLSGSYEATWDTITALIHELAPDTKKNVLLTGRSVSDFKLTGPIAAPNIDPPFRTANGGAGVGWAKATLYGVDMGAANLAPTLRDGEIVLPATTIPAAGGKVNLRGQVDLKPKEPVLKIPDRLDALETVVITKELGEQLLSRINPIFSQMARVEGNVSFSTQDILVPLGDSLTKGGSGRGRLDLKNMKIQPGGILGDALALGGLNKSDLYSVTVSSVDFLIKNGRIYYDNLTMTFPGEFDLKFLGSVGFDGTLDLVMSVPIRPALLEKLGVKLGSAEIGKRFAGTRINIPLTGTREHPKLDFSKVDKAALLKGIVPDTPEKAVDTVLKALQDNSKGGSSGGAAPAQPAPKQTPPAQQPPPKQAPPAQPPPKEKPKPLLPGLRPKKKN